MHALSKVLLGFVAVAAIAAIFLAMMLFDTRNEWLKRVSEGQASVEQLEEDLRTKKLVVSDLENEVNRRMTNWGRAWQAGPQDIQLLDAELGTVAIEIGTSNGLGAREEAVGRPLPVIHLFGTDEEGSSSYLGAFRVTTAEATRVAAQMIRKPFPGEIDQWQATAGVRVWNNIPGSWQSLQARFQAQIAEAYQDVQDEQGRLATLDVLNAKSEEHLARRMAELNGNDQPVEGASQDVVDGLVKSLRGEASGRNRQLLVVDQLRHEYHSKYNELIDLLQQNRNLEKQLPHPGTASEPPVIQPTVGNTEPTSRQR